VASVRDPTADARGSVCVELSDSASGAAVALGLKFLGLGNLNPGALPDPFALFFEWDYAAINGLGLSGKLHVGDNVRLAALDNSSESCPKCSSTCTPCSICETRMPCQECT